MKIVIDIDDNVYTRLFDNGEECVADMYRTCVAIRKSTPLPKGHKRLIAEPTEEDIAKTVLGQSDFVECIRDAVRMVFVNAPTIIEADNVESEGKE